MPLEYSGMAGKIANTLNDIELNQRMAAELDRISTVVVKQDHPACLAELLRFMDSLR